MVDSNTHSGGNGNVKVAVRGRTPPHLVATQFSSEHQPSQRPGPRKDVLTDLLEKWLTGKLTKEGRPSVSTLQKYNSAATRIVEMLVNLAGGQFDDLPVLTSKQASTMVTAAQREVWQRMAGRPGLSLDLTAFDDVLEQVELIDRKVDVPLPMRSDETEASS